MSRVMNMVGGGGSGSGDLPLGSTIVVSSDEGVIITVSRGLETQSQVVPASGSVSFTVKQSGRWIVTGNKSGEPPIIDYVDVLEDDSTYNKSIFWIYYLYNEGDEYISRTGGFTVVNKLTLVKNPTNMESYLTSPASDVNWGHYATNNLVDLKNFTKLYFDVGMTSGTTSYGRLGVAPTRGAEFTSNVTVDTNADHQIKTINISSINSAYVQVRNSGRNDFRAHIYVHKIWLE